MIHDYLRSEKMSGVRMPKLKGHVRIRLYNPNTWKQEIVEGDNMITNAISDIFASNLCGVMNYNSMLPLYAKMFGGVLCFRNDLDVTSEHADDDYFIPDNSVNTVIAHAGQTALTDQSDDITRGNPLSTSMTVTDGAVTLAWEWGSAAGNGKIKSVGLTHSDVGDAGTGSYSNAFKAMTPNINAYYGLSPEKKVSFFDDDYAYIISVSGTTLTLTRFPNAYNKVGLIGMNFSYTSGSYVSGVPDIKTLTLSTSMGGQPYFAYDKSSKLLYLFYNTSISASVDVHIIDISTWGNSSMTITHPSWELQSSVGILAVYGNDPQPFPLPISRGYVYLPKINAGPNTTYASEFLRIQLSSTGNQTRIQSEGSAGSTGVFIPNADNRIIAGKSFVINNGVMYPTAVGSPDVVMRPTSANYMETTILDQGVGLVQMARLKLQGSGQYYPSISKFYLATKFKFNEIEKTNAKSMVVTYTLTEVSGNE